MSAKFPLNYLHLCIWRYNCRSCQ